MANLKRAASSPLCKDGKKAKEDECLICLEMATENVLECVWCEGRIHAGCSGMSEDQCRVLDTVTNSIVFFCPKCLQLLPTALKSFDSLSLVDTKVTAIEKSVLEIQKAEKQFSSLSTKHDSLYKSVIY